jgi:hypothetical protein
MMKKILIIIPIILFITICLFTLNAQQPEKNIKAYFSGLQGKEVFFNDGTPPCKISKIEDDYFIAQMDNSFSYVIPFHSICKIETVGKSKIVTLFLSYHADLKTR